jgi:hypothetical protein
MKKIFVSTLIAASCVCGAAQAGSVFITNTSANLVADDASGAPYWEIETRNGYVAVYAFDGTKFFTCSLWYNQGGFASFKESALAFGNTQRFSTNNAIPIGQVWKDSAGTCTDFVWNHRR